MSYDDVRYLRKDLTALGLSRSAIDMVIYNNREYVGRDAMSRMFNGMGQKIFT